jgi:hypothetical protein
VHGLRRTYHRLRNHFGHTRWNTKVTWVIWNLVLVFLETVFVLVQDRCTVGTKRIICLEKPFWMHMMELLCDVGHVESRFGPFGGSVTLDVR